MTMTAQEITDIRLPKSKTAQPRSTYIRSYASMIYTQTHSLTRTARFVVRSLIRKPTTLKWLRYIENQPSLADTPPEVRRVLGDKIHRAFARYGITTADRVELLIAHYEIMSSALPAHVLSSMVAGRRFPLLQMIGRHGEARYMITLSREMISEHQGEMTILFIEGSTNIPLARLVFNLLLDHEGKKVFTIAGLQGPDPEHKHKIVEATRELDGLRPKQIVLETACAIARWLNSTRIVATAKKNHVSQNKRKWQRKVKADYDTFWEEFNLRTLSNGDYEMPLIIPRRDISEVPSKKRKAWLARTARLENLATDVDKSLTLLRTQA